jgi:hypothetical protein
MHPIYIARLDEADCGAGSQIGVLLDDQERQLSAAIRAAFDLA